MKRNLILTVFPHIKARGAYLIFRLYGAALIGGMRLFQSQRNYLHEISKPYGLLMFSGGRGKVHWQQMG